MAQLDPDGQPADPSSSAGVGPADADELEEYECEDELDEDEDLGAPVETIDEQGRRHIRRAAPEGTEQILENEVPRRTGLSDRAERWRQRSATGTVLTAFAFGLREAFEPDRNQPAIIMETSGDPPHDLPVEAQLEQLGPRQSSVKVRTYLLGNNLPGGPAGIVPSAPGDGEGRNSGRTTAVGDQSQPNGAGNLTSEPGGSLSDQEDQGRAEGDREGPQ